MANTYGLNIPDYQPLSFAGMEKIPEIYQAAKKASADEARKKWEFDEAKRKAEIENNKQLMPGSDTFRAAAQSTAMGNVVGAPYGIHFDEENVPVPASDSATPNSADAAKFLMSGAPQPPLQGPTPSGKPLSDEVNAPLLDFKPPKMTPETSPDLEPAPHAEAPIDPDTLAASNEAKLPTTKHLYATSRGSRFEMPAQTPTDLYDEAAYNALVDKLVAKGRTEEDALKIAEARRKTDIGEGGKNHRFDASLGQKQDTQLTREERLKMQQDALSTSRENSQGRDRAIMGAAGSRASAGNAAGIPTMGKEQGIALNALNQRITRIQSVATWPKLIESEKAADLLLHDVETGAVPLQNREAQVLAAKIIRGRVTNEEMHQLYDNLGGARDYFSRLVHNTGLGELSPQQLSQLQTSVQVLLNQDRDMRLRAQQSARVGLRSFGVAMPNEAQDAYEMMMSELGLPAEQLFGEQGSMMSAPPQPPARPPHGRPHASPPHAPAPQSAPTPPPGPAPIDDAAAVKMAQERYAKNPNDAVAKKVLQMHGLLK